ncbi:hypothetical protein Poli38472_000948 [Pythium oligandrum]|uniref:FAD-binding FR-type domain-containing protein n=1 Tax=Pythium oligandrum TaxID=41045 RepID=A0A8K1CCN6_PYTOL|nr:hypothetical protein Poli38472_000948 [Pythium oligandrum]|eukprot:TMW60906.1 hypothetical protein Poli38472_000948 [Pythium oligandrum]
MTDWHRFPDASLWQTWWYRHRETIGWMTAYALMNIVVFVLRYSRYPSDSCVSSWPAIAKGSAELVLLNCVLTLLTVSYGFLDRLRPSRRSFLWLARPLEKHQTLHMLTGSVVILMAVVHSIAWALIVHAARSCSESDWESSRFHHHPFLRDGESIAELMKRLPMWTGIVLLGCVLILLSFCLPCVRRRCFKAFAAVHVVVLVPFVGILLFHGVDQWSSRLQAPYWLLPPIALYLFEHRRRLSMNAGTVDVLGYGCTSDTISLTLAKPDRFTRRFKPGMFVYLQVPDVSRLEWHPFSVTSAPDDANVQLRLRIVGDWTKAVSEWLATPCSDRVVRLDGPFGTPSLAYQQYDHVMLVAAGMGITPFLSVLRHHLHLLRRPDHEGIRPRTLRLVWVLREAERAEWLVETLADFSDLTPLLATVDIQLFLTARSDDVSTASSNDLLRCFPGRPHWPSVVHVWLDSAPHEQSHALFVCGSHTVARALKQSVARVQQQQRRGLALYEETFT